MRDFWASHTAVRLSVIAAALAALLFAPMAFAAGDRTITFSDAVVTLSADKKCAIEELVKEAAENGIPELSGGHVVLQDGSKRKLCWIENNGLILFVDETGNGGAVEADVAKPVKPAPKKSKPKTRSM
jgi:hypothetical protein